MNADHLDLAEGPDIPSLVAYLWQLHDQDQDPEVRALMAEQIRGLEADAAEAASRPKPDPFPYPIPCFLCDEDLVTDDGLATARLVEIGSYPRIVHETCAAEANGSPETRLGRVGATRSDGEAVFVHGGQAPNAGPGIEAAFREWIDTGATAADAAAILSALAFGPEPMPPDLCDQLGLPVGASYARGVEHILDTEGMGLIGPSPLS